MTAGSWFRVFVVVAAVGCTSCGARLMKLPVGPGTPASDAVDALTDATAACRAVSTLSAEARVTGSVGGTRVRGTLLIGVAKPASARLEAVAPAGQPIFFFVATGNVATLFLPGDNRVLEQGRPAAVLEAVAGVPLDAADLREALTGCPPFAGQTAGRQFGSAWRVVTVGSADAYLRRNAAADRWELVATVHRASPEEWRAEYADFEGGLPRTVRLASADGKRFNLQLALSQVELNAKLGPEVFRVSIPRDAERITIEELRRSGPLGTTSDSTQRTQRR